MDAGRVSALRELLAHTPWWAQARDLAQAVRRTPGPGHLLLVGTPQVEPWHLAAHLGDEARLSGQAQLAPQLVRWRPPSGAAPHLSIDLTRLEDATRGETVFVVAPADAPDALLERVDHAKHVGATVVSLDAGDDRLGGLAHERMTVTDSGLIVPAAVAAVIGARLDQRLDGPAVTADVAAGLTMPASFDLAQHLVSAAAGEASGGRLPWRMRLAGLLDQVSGPSTGRAHRPSS